MNTVPLELKQRILQYISPKNRSRVACTSKSCKNNVNVFKMGKSQKIIGQWKNYVKKKKDLHQLILDKRRQWKAYFSNAELEELHHIITPNNQFRNHDPYFIIPNNLKIRQYQTGRSLTGNSPSILLLEFDDTVLYITRTSMDIYKKNNTVEIDPENEHNPNIMFPGMNMNQPYKRQRTIIFKSPVLSYSNALTKLMKFINSGGLDT